LSLIWDTTREKNIDTIVLMKLPCVPSGITIIRKRAFPTEVQERNSIIERMAPPQNFMSKKSQTIAIVTAGNQKSV